MPHVDEASSSGRLTPRKLRHAYGRQCVEPGVDIRMSRSSAPVGSPSYLAPRELDNPMQVGEQIQLLHAGRNFQKHFAPTRMLADSA